MLCKFFALLCKLFCSLGGTNPKHLYLQPISVVIIKHVKYKEQTYLTYAVATCFDSFKLL